MARNVIKLEAFPGAEEFETQPLRPFLGSRIYD